MSADDLEVVLARLAAHPGAKSADPGPETDDGAGGADAHLGTAVRLGEIAGVAEHLQRGAVDAAREAGASWAHVGRALGITRQAAQQRFGTREHAALASQQRLLGPVTRAREVEELASAGRQGWRPVVSRHGEHVLVRDERALEVRRVSMLGPSALGGRDGWLLATTRFPDCFQIRPLDSAI
ncbi:hypothetical protein [uncultured Pseudokineococcus sp.]|uniref:hypothetical protein n=1 Tax=uncultured Pseudokineococcus sp. TaxID=1642928 RepID=UPI00261C57CB|nr:hypothetical protein [uncultured Pseudokineococcus sp.]